MNRPLTFFMAPLMALLIGNTICHGGQRQFSDMALQVLSAKTVQVFPVRLAPKTVQHRYVGYVRANGLIEADLPIAVAHFLTKGDSVQLRDFRTGSPMGSAQVIAAGDRFQDVDMTYRYRLQSSEALPLAIGQPLTVVFQQTLGPNWVAIPYSSMIQVELPESGKGFQGSRNAVYQLTSGGFVDLLPVQAGTLWNNAVLVQAPALASGSCIVKLSSKRFRRWSVIDAISELPKAECPQSIRVQPVPKSLIPPIEEWELDR